MPPGDVTISGTFSQTPTKSAYLEFLNVSVNSTITPALIYSQKNYTAEIPHIFPTDQNQKFSIIAIPEDPQAEVSIAPTSEAGGENWEYTLTEGITEYTITVSQPNANPNTNTYNFTVSYEPDLTLKSIELTSGENEGWIQNVLVQDGQTITVPYGIITIAASSNVEGVALAASKTGSGDFSTGGPSTEWTLTYPDNPNIYAFYSDVKITSTKSTNGGDYRKDFILKFKKIVDPNWPTSYWAESIPKDNGVSIIKEGDKYYEVHTFIKSGTLSVNATPTGGSLTARMLVVAGGGGAGGAWYPSSGAGAGGMLENNNYVITAGSYSVLVGTGGVGGAKTSQDGNLFNGVNGGDSGFGDPTNGGILAYGGGASAGRTTSGAISGNGSQGGSGGGGGSSVGAKKDGDGGTSYGNPGGAISSSGNYAAGGGGASGAGQSGAIGDTKNTAGLYGGAGRENDITGKIKVYAAGGMTPPNKSYYAGDNGASNTGNGGGGGWQNRGGNGGSGIVVVRFQARPNDTGSEQSNE